MTLFEARVVEEAEDLAYPFSSPSVAANGVDASQGLPALIATAIRRRGLRLREFTSRSRRGARAPLNIYDLALVVPEMLLERPVALVADSPIHEAIKPGLEPARGRRQV